MTSTTTNELPAWVASTCPDWCQQDHQPEHLWGDDAELHVRRFGDDDITVAVSIGSDGSPRQWDFTVEGFDADHPDDLDDAAAALRKASAWIRETVLPMFDGQRQA